MIFANTLCWVSLTTAISLQASRPPIETPAVDRLPSSSDSEQWQQIMSEEESARRLPRRKVAARAADQGSTTVISIEVPTSTTSKRSAVTPAAATGPLPSPMDSLPTTFPDDVTGKCPAFIQSFLADNTFKSCYPFSMLLQVKFNPESTMGGSNSFFDAQKSLVSLTQVLDASCKADVKMCTSWLADLADQFQQDGNCGGELASGNTVVTKAYEGLKAYQPLYSATCLKEPESQAYCYATAATDTKDFSSVYLYYLPLNRSMPDTATPSCDWCNQQTMGIFQSFSSNRKSSIAATYTGGSAVMNRVCGAEYVNSTLPVATESAAIPMQQTPLLVMFSFLLMVFTHLFL
ncbi:hypothetical protein PG997_005160 [Apiospora hydei]|uniref:DUF7729 domain-containing protein n=1 Tax=Apiospora hydei TaxID=1337664 RepID=A0ABR1X4B6_9PEZI